MKTYIPATPYAKLLSRQNGIDLSLAQPTGNYGAVRAADVMKVEATPSRAKATPLAKRMAQGMGIDITQVVGSGHGGKVTRADVLAARPKGDQPAAKAPAQQGEKREGMSAMRKVVARRMLQSHTEIPPVTQVVRNDVTALMEARQKLNANGGRKYSMNDFILKAVAKALDSNRHMLVSIDGDEIIYKDNINLGMAVAIDSGLIVPVINDADKLTLEQLSDAAKDLAVRARENKLLPDEYRGNTFTVSNLGMFDVETFTPIINQPDAAILGVCSVFDELALVDGAVVVRKVMRTCLTYDHRLLDGASAARFQKELKRLLENPIEILM